MTKRLPIALGTIAAISLAGAAWANDPLPRSGDDLSVFKEMGEWTIYADATRGSCLAERVDAAGNAMQMGLTKDKSAAYVGVFTPAELDFKRSQPIEIAIDGMVFTGKAEGVKSKKLAGGQSGGYTVTNNLDLINAIAEGQTLVAFPEKTGVFSIDLTGTKAAIEEIEACNAGLAG